MTATATGSSVDVAPPKKRELGTGLFIALPALMLFFSASMQLSRAPQVVEMFTGKFGFEKSALTPIGILEIVVTVLYLIPRTAVFGAILIAAYLFLRDTRLRALLPLRR